MTTEKRTRAKRVTKEDAEIGLHVFRARVRKNKTKTETAAAVGISYQQLRKYERGEDRISASLLKKIAIFLKIDANDLLQDSKAYKTITPSDDQAHKDFNQRVLYLLNDIQGQNEKEAFVTLMESLGRRAST